MIAVFLWATFVRFCHPTMLLCYAVKHIVSIILSIHRKEQRAARINTIITYLKMLTLFTFTFAKRQIQCNTTH